MDGGYRLYFTISITFDKISCQKGYIILQLLGIHM